MECDMKKVTIRLPQQDVEFAKAYAKAHGLTLGEMFDRMLQRLRELQEHTPSSELEAITGLVPSDVDAIEEHRRYEWERHSR